jgi:hypothetical protein
MGCASTDIQARPQPNHPHQGNGLFGEREKIINLYQFNLTGQE